MQDKHIVNIHISGKAPNKVKTKMKTLSYRLAWI